MKAQSPMTQLRLYELSPGEAAVVHQHLETFSTEAIIWNDRETEVTIVFYSRSEYETFISKLNDEGFLYE